MVRKVSDADAQVVRDLQAKATLRRLRRKIERIYDGGHENYYNFLLGCRADVGNVEVGK